jgi:hypothetical protein
MWCSSSFFLTVPLRLPAEGTGTKGRKTLVDVSDKANLPIVVCPACQGLTFVVRSCRCRNGGDQLLVDWHQPPGIDRGPYRDCEVCAGVGSVSESCHRCHGAGNCRSQLVLTVANVDSGGVASISVLPALLDPRPLPNGRYAADLMPVVRGLADQVAAAEVYEPSRPQSPITADCDLLVFMPPQWRPDLPERGRLALAAVAIADAAQYLPWRVYYGRAAAPPPDLNKLLNRLCALADQLCLDFVIDHRRDVSVDPDDPLLLWGLRYEVPGSPVPTDAPAHHNAQEALTQTTPEEAIRRGIGLGRPRESQHQTAPAYWITTPVASPDPPHTASWAEVARRVTEVCGTGAGAVAIWRDRRWHFIQLTQAGMTEVLQQEDTGQVTSRNVSTLMRVGEPPPPIYWDQQIPSQPCPDCASGTAWSRCWCALNIGGGGEPDPACEQCGGAGAYAQGWCATCGDAARISSGVVITYTDLDRRTLHINWRTGGDATVHLVSTTPAGTPVLQLAAEYQVAQWGQLFGVTVASMIDLAADTELDSELRDGLVTAFDPTADPITQHLHRASRGRPGARLLVYAAQPPEPGADILQLLRLILGLGLATEVTVESHRHRAGEPLSIQGERWLVNAVPPDTPVDELRTPLHTTLHRATTSLGAYLPTLLHQTVPAAPTQPPAVPQQPVPVSVEVGNLQTLMRRLAHHYLGQAVMARFNRNCCRIYAGGFADADLVATAPSLPAAVRALLGASAADG